MVRGGDFLRVGKVTCEQSRKLAFRRLLNMRKRPRSSDKIARGWAGTKHTYMKIWEKEADSYMGHGVVY